MRGFHFSSLIDQTTLEQAILFGLFWGGVAVTVALAWHFRPSLSPVWLGLVGLAGGAVNAGVAGWWAARRRALRKAREEAPRKAARDAETHRVAEQIRKGARTKADARAGGPRK